MACPYYVVLHLRRITPYYYVLLRTTTYYYVIVRTTTYYYVLLRVTIRTTAYYYALLRILCTLRTTYDATVATYYVLSKNLTQKFLTLAIIAHNSHRMLKRRRPSWQVSMGCRRVRGKTEAKVARSCPTSRCAFVWSSYVAHQPPANGRSRLGPGRGGHRSFSDTCMDYCIARCS